MELFKQDSNVDFMGARYITAAISAIFFLFAVASISINGMKWGLDFTGGTQIEISYQKPAKLNDIRDQLSKAGYKQAVVQSYGTSKDVLISIAPQANVDQTQMVNQMMSALPGAQKQREEYIGPQVGQELAVKGMLAILVAVLATMIYIAMRFEYRFAVSAAAALIHDPLLVLGIFSFFQIDFDLKTLAAILAVIGYSLNDTIVVFDRVRENFRKVRKASAIEIMNLSINQTLSRTIMTSALTLVVVLALFLYGGETIHGFALAWMIGIIFGTYSSIYVAGTLAIYLGLNRADMLLPEKKQVDDMP